jgi:hypothetical protein
MLKSRSPGADDGGRPSLGPNITAAARYLILVAIVFMLIVVLRPAAVGAAGPR